MLEGDAVVVGLGEFLAEVEDAEVTGGVADDAVELFEDEEGDVAAVEHFGLVAEDAAVFGGEGGFGGLGVVVELDADGFLVGDDFELVFEVFEVGAEAEGVLAVGAAVGVHLEESEIQSNLDAGVAVKSGKHSACQLSGLEGPVGEDGGDVWIHVLFGI